MVAICTIAAQMTASLGEKGECSGEAARSDTSKMKMMK